MSPKQSAVLDSKARSLMLSGGFRSGKTVVACIKIIVQHLTQANNVGLIGRLTYRELSDTVQDTFFKLLNPQWIRTWNKSDGVLILKNGCKVLFRHLDTVSEDELKGLEIGFALIDQVEEVSEEVYLILKSRLNLQHVTDRQIIMTCNPTLFWGYKYFKTDNDGTNELVEFSMLDNKSNLPEDYIKDMMKRPENWRRQYVHGIWDESLLSDRSVIAIEYIGEQKSFLKERLRVFNGDVDIYHNLVPRDTYQMGIDTSEGIEDCSAISVRNLVSGEQVAFWKGRIQPELLGQKALPLARYFNEARIIPEINSSGLAFLASIKDKYENIYKRKVFDKESEVEMENLGWRTTGATKPLLIDNYITLLRDGRLRTRSHHVTSEMATFIYTTESKKHGQGAAAGFHDDALIADMLACLEFDEYRYVPLKGESVSFTELLGVVSSHNAAGY